MYPFSKRPSERETITIDFRKRIPAGLEIVSQAVAVTRTTGTGTLTLVGSGFSGTLVYCMIDGGVLGDVHEVVLTAVLSDTQRKEEIYEVTIEKDDE